MARGVHKVAEKEASGRRLPVTMSQQTSRKRKGNPKDDRNQASQEERKGTGKLRIRDYMAIP
jgi:hypothetical protein